MDAKEEIARLVYNWRFGNKQDFEGDCLDQSCLALAGRILEVVENDRPKQ